MTKENVVYISKKSVFQSLLCDLNTFIVMLVAFWFNYTFIAGNDILDVAILAGIIAIPCSHSLKTHHNVSEEKIKKIEKILGEEND